MKASANLIIISFALLSAANAFAETEIKSEVNKLKLTTDQNLTYKVTVTSNEANVPLAQMPEFKGFNILSSDQTSSIIFTSRETKASVVYSIVLAPVKTGKLKIEPAQVKEDGLVCSSQGFEIEVSPGKAAPSARQKEKPSFQEEIRPDPENPQVTL